MPGIVATLGALENEMTSFDRTTDALLDPDAAQRELFCVEVAYSVATAAVAHVVSPSLARFLR